MHKIAEGGTELYDNSSLCPSKEGSGEDRAGEARDESRLRPALLCNTDPFHTQARY